MRAMALRTARGYRGRVDARLFAAVMVACSLGCGGGSSGKSIPIDQLASEYAAVFCHKMFTCCDASELAARESTGPDEAACRSVVAATVNDPVLQAQVAAGRVVYHGDRARSCLDTVAALPCQQWALDEKLIRFPACDAITEGTLAAGSACAISDQCIDGFCGSSTGELVCAPPAQAGQPCSFAKCVSGLACRTDELASPGICGPRLPDGAACVDQNDCASGYCIGDGTGMASCGLLTTCNGV